MAERFIGLMSGTSLDGVDGALVDFDADPADTTQPPRCLATCYLPYPAAIAAEALALNAAGANELRRSALLANQLADLYAQTVQNLLAQARVDARQVRAIGCHGQTLRHAPADGYSLQLNNPARLAEATGICVVADFRARDIAAGGQGAPLTPAFHNAWFRAPDRRRAIVNIGGISNVTLLAPDRPVAGCDCGPGNMLMDAWIQRHLEKPYDARGAWAQQGSAPPALLARLLAHPFFGMSPPKSCGREEFNLAWLSNQLQGDEPPVDVQAALLQLTASGIHQAVADQADEIYVCGGGAHNTALMDALRRRLPQASVAATDALGLPADWVEAVAFAWLARQTLHNLPGNLPEVTGARGPRILGAVYPGAAQMVGGGLP